MTKQWGDFGNEEGLAQGKSWETKCRYQIFLKGLNIEPSPK